MFRTKPSVFFSPRDYEFTNITPKLDNITIKRIETDEERNACVDLSKNPKIKKILKELTILDFLDLIKGLIIKDRDKIIGWRTYYENEKSIEGVSYALDPDYWGTGLSKYLLNYWIDLMKKKDLKK
ncbi:MAG: GNAT family N-acetyltransferase [Candidatus Micrarchaeia archaeon]|jgi:GNAT superfamily N-acetyltransferase